MTPLEDPAYSPANPPVDGRVPDVVAKWGPASQLRWFNRYRSQLEPMPPAEWDRFYCTTDDHRGSCCSSCSDDYLNGYSYVDGCCCRAESAD
jgi:hypothetical protein